MRARDLLLESNRYEKDGNVFHFDDEGQLHRDNDEPAIEFKDGSKEYWKNGVRYDPESGANVKKGPMIKKTPHPGGWDVVVITHPDGTVEYAREKNGSVRYYKEPGAQGEIHRTGDNPAIIHWNGTKEWWVDGSPHRDGDKPAIEHYNGGKEWYTNGVRHRDGDEPAIDTAKEKAWWKKGLEHRDGDKPAVVYSNGIEEWWVNGKRHREGGNPAMTWPNGQKMWYYNGTRQSDRYHR